MFELYDLLIKELDEYTEKDIQKLKELEYLIKVRLNTIGLYKIGLIKKEGKNDEI